MSRKSSTWQYQFANFPYRLPLPTSDQHGTEIVSGLRFDARPTIFRFLPLGTMVQVWSEFGVVRINGTAQGYEP